jgi:hypothetical protein
MGLNYNMKKDSDFNKTIWIFFYYSTTLTVLVLVYSFPL